MDRSIERKRKRETESTSKPIYGVEKKAAKGKRRDER